jgi:hypothetical protein
MSYDNLSSVSQNENKTGKDNVCHSISLKLARCIAFVADF